MEEKPTIPEVWPLVLKHYQKHGNGAGGIFHVVLDDGNVEDHFVQSCLDEAIKRGDQDEIKLAELLLRMSKTQRKKLYCNPAKYDIWWRKDHA